MVMQIPLDKLKINQKSYYYPQNSAFWGWLSMESQSQNPEFRINPENFHPCRVQDSWQSECRFSSLCLGLSKKFYPYSFIVHVLDQPGKSPQDDRKIVDWDIKHQLERKNNSESSQIVLPGIAKVESDVETYFWTRWQIIDYSQCALNYHSPMI